MAKANKIRIPNAVTRTLLCVNACVNGDYCGVLYNPYLSEPVAFAQVKDIIRVMEDFFDSIAHPQPAFEYRSFSSGRRHAPRVAAIPRRCQTDAIFENRGVLGSFLVDVQHRQNATWQGSVRWMEADSQIPFRSTLELLKMMDRAMEQGIFSA